MVAHSGKRNYDSEPRNCADVPTLHCLRASGLRLLQVLGRAETESTINSQSYQNRTQILLKSLEARISYF